MELQGKTAVITGGASGIGLATARQFASSGANLVLGDIEEAPLEAALESLRADGAHVIGEFGTAHLVFNNAGVAAGPAIGTPKSIWDWVMGVNVDGVINGVNAFVPLFLEQNEGYVISTGSLAGLGGVPYMGAYCASKFAVVAISETLFHELAATGKDVHVSVLCPGFVRTRIHESHRNMPNELKSYNEDPTAQAVADFARDAVNSGIDASEVALAIENAVRESKFWILPHEHAAIRMTEQRLEWMRGGPPPTINLSAATKP